MRILVAGANGKVARLLLPLLVERGHAVRALIRAPVQAPAMRKAGAEPVVGDLEDDCSEAVAGCDAVFFCAGSGPHTGPDKTLDVDRDGAVRLIDAAVAAGVPRFIMLSAMRTEAVETAPEKLRHYLRAKKAADDYLRRTDLDWRIVKPGRLTDEPPRGRVRVAESLAGEYGEIPRGDAAAVLVAVLEAPNAVRRQIECIGGNTPITEAVAGF